MRSILVSLLLFGATLYGYASDQHASGEVDLTNKTIYVEYAAAASLNGTTALYVRGATITRTAAGRWQVRFTAAHPDGNQYCPLMTTAESGTLRDTPDITIVEGTLNAAGFDVQITTGDNGGGADTLVDAPWCFIVTGPCVVSVPVEK